MNRRLVHKHGNIVEEDETKGDEKSFSVMQWNILAQTLAQNGMFQFATKEVLDWQHRKELIVKEILKHNPDIGCFEEVDCFHLLKEDFHSNGYQGFFVPKPKSPCLNFEENIGPDGTLLISKEYFPSSANAYHKVLCLEDGTETNSTVLIYEKRLSDHVIFILTTHLKAKSQNEEIRRQQAEHLIKIIDQIKSCSSNCSVILLGDFNAEPSEPAIQRLMKYGLKSAYKDVLGNEADITTYKIRTNVGLASRCIDYIFYHSACLTPVSVLSIPKQQDFGEEGLPNAHFPSDHIPLLVNFKLMQ